MSGSLHGIRLGGHRMLLQRKIQIHSLLHSQFLKILPVNKKVLKTVSHVFLKTNLKLL